MSSTLAVADCRLPRSRSSSVTESASPGSTSSDSPPSSDPDIHLSLSNKGLFSMEIDTVSNAHSMDMDADASFDSFDLSPQALNTFQGYNVNLDDVVLSSLPIHEDTNIKTDMLTLEEIIRDGAFDPSPMQGAAVSSYPSPSPAFHDLFVPPPPPPLRQSHHQSDPNATCVDPSSMQSQSQSNISAVAPSSFVISEPVFKTEPPNVLLLSPGSQGTSGTSTPVKHEAHLSRPQLLPYGPADFTCISSEVVYPPKDACLNLPIFFPSIPAEGTKSRVETQIKLAFELGFPTSSVRSPRTSTMSTHHASSSSSASNSPSASPTLGTRNGAGSAEKTLLRPTHDKVGTYNFVRLPRGTTTKRSRPSSAQRRESRTCDLNSEETLEMTAEVVCCSPPHALVHSCSSCQSRESKRTARKLAARVRPPGTRSKPKAKASGKLGKRAKEQESADAVEEAPAEEGDEEEPNADSSIIQFNCSEIVEFGGGAVVLPMRITCYCRHHKEKLGFQIVFTLRDTQGRVVGKGTTPPILITDDHKSTSAVSKLPPMHPLRHAAGPPIPYSIEETNATDVLVQTLDQGTSRAPDKRRDADSGARKVRPKPYDGRPMSRIAGVGPGIEGRQGIVLALHPAHAKGQSRAGSVTGSVSPATPPNTTSGTEPADAPNSSAPHANTSPMLPHPETSLPSPSRSQSSLFTPYGNAIMSPQNSTVNITPSFLPTAPPSPSSLSSPSSSQVDLVAQQPSLQPITDHQTLLDASFPLYPPIAFSPGLAALPKIHRLIPSSGPTSGGIEITVLGSNFHASLPLECVFGGAVASSTHRWSDNTLVCVLPPRASPGVVSVEFQGIKDDSGQDHCLFNYVDESDRQLMELALQVVGLKMTGKIEEARSVAMRIVGNTNTPSPTMTAGELSQMNSLSGAPLVHHSFLGSLGGMDLETLVIKLLTLLDVPAEARAERLPAASQVISHPNATGQTLLHLSVQLALPALVSCLAERSIDLDVRNNNGLTALHFAALAGWKEGAEILLKAGADPSLRDRMGLTAAARAKNGRFEELECLLREMEERENVLEGGSGEDGDDEAWGQDDVSEAGDSDAEPSLPWRTAPPQYTARSPIPSPSNTESSPDELSELELRIVPKTTATQSEATPTNDLAQQPLIDSKPSLDEKHDASFVGRLQRTIPQGILPNVQIPGLPQLQLPNMLAAPWGALPQIPVFPVLVPIPNLPPLPNWPAFPWPEALSGEKKEAPVDGERQQQPPLAMLWTAYDSLTNSDWRAQWEKWTAQVAALQTANTRGRESPPMYTPRPEEQQSRPERRTPTLAGEEPDTSSRGRSVTNTLGTSPSRHSSSKATRRMGYGAMKVPETEVESYHYRPKKKTNQKKDRMLVLFWIPILFLGLAYALYVTLPVAVAGLSRATRRVFPQLPRRDGVRE